MTKQSDSNEFAQWVQARQLSDENVRAAIDADDEFKAAVLIHTQNGENDPRFAAWAMGPVKAQELISDWLEKNNPKSSG